MPTIQDIVYLAEDTNPEKILAVVSATQAIHESRKGSGWSDLALKHNNWFGIKGSGTAGSVNLRTQEVLKGSEVTVRDGFAANYTIEESFLQHRRLMLRPRYERVRKSKTPEEAFKMLVVCGYATDKSYSEKLLRIYNQYVKVYSIMN